MRQKINVKIHKQGQTSNVILECIGEMNAGKVQFSARDMEGHVALLKAYIPETRKGYTFIKDATAPETYHVSEDGGKTFTLSLEWVEIHELPEVDKEIETELQRDDLQNVNI